MNCWYMTEVGLSSNSRMGKDSSMDHGAIVRGIILLSLSYHVGDKARDPNPKYLRDVLSRGLHRGDARGVWANIYLPPPIFPSWKAQQQWQGHGEHDVWRVLVHKIRLVSLKPVVQDIGRAYIKNRHRDEWIPENPVVASFPNNVSRGTRPLFFDCYRCCIARGYRCRLIFWISLVIFATNLYLYVYRSL